MRLRSWSRAARDVEFDPRTGKGRVVALPGARDEGDELSGFAARERPLLGLGEWFAVYRGGDELFFHAGSRRWELQRPEIRLLHERRNPLRSRFLVLEGGREVYAIDYSHVIRSLFALIDPTYDKLDEDSDFFLEFMAAHARDPAWQENALARWTSAPEAGRTVADPWEG